MATLQEQIDDLKARSSGQPTQAQAAEDAASEAARQAQIENLDPEQKQIRDAVVTGQPVGATDSTPAVDKDLIRTKEEPVPYLSVLGMGMQTERDLYGATNWKKVTPNVSITEVMDFKNPEVVALFNRATDLVDSEGNMYDVSGMSLEDRVRDGDRRGASFMVIDGEQIEIPWWKGIEKLTKIPEGLNSQVLKNGVPINTLDMTVSDMERVRFASMMFTANLGNREVTRPLYGAYLNNVLMKNGVDDRGRFAILRDRLSDPSMGDIEGVGRGVVDAVGRSVIETGLWGIGEAIDWFDGFGENVSISGFKGRQAFMDDNFASFPQALQDRYAQKGVYVDLATAEELAYTYSGLLPRATRLAAEMIGLSKGTGALKGLISQRELSNFESVLAGELKKNPDLTVDDVTNLYLRTREVAPFSPLRILSKGQQKKIIQDRLATAYQIVDTRLPPKFRAEVRQIRDRQATLIQRERSLVKRQQRSYSPDTELELRDLRKEIASNRLAMTEAERISSVPKYMRDINVQDKYMVVGAATAGHFFGQEFEMIDPAFGELGGLFAGLIISISGGNVPRGLRAFNAARARSSFPFGSEGPFVSPDGTITSTGKRNLQFLVTSFSRANPDFARQIEANAQRINRSFDILEAKGVDRKYLNASVPIITDLITLRHYADAVKKSLNVGDAFDMDVAEQYQEAFKGLQDLNGELNRLIKEMVPADMADNEFFEFMRAMSRQGTDLQKSIESDLAVINEKGVGHYLNALTANSDIIQEGAIDTLGEGETAKTFPDAVGSLLARNIFEQKYINREQVETAAGTAVRAINESLIASSAQMIERIGVSSARGGDGVVAPIEEVLPSTLPRHKDNIHHTTTPSTLFAFQLEAANEVARKAASYPYDRLKKVGEDGVPEVRFVDANNRPLSNDITVDTSDLFTDLISARTTGLGEGISPRLVDNIVLEISDPIFEELARSQGIPVNKLLQDMKADLETEGFVFGTGVNRGRPLQAQVADFMQQAEAREGFDGGMFRMDPAGLRRLDEIIRREAYSAAQEGKTEVSRALYTLSNTNVEQKFDSFVVDGVPVERLQIQIDGEGTFALTDYLRDANAGWRQYKERFHDETGGALVPSLLFNKRSNLSQPTSEFPTGVQTATLPSQWLTADMLIDPEKAAVYMAGVNRAMGKDIVNPVDGMLSPRLVEGEPFTEGQRAIVRASFAEWVQKNVISNKLTPAEITEAARNVERNLRMVSKDGTDVPLVNLMNIVDDHTSFSRKSIGNARYDTEMQNAEKLINTQLENATAPARELAQGLEDATAVLGRLTSTDMAAADIASVLIDGGMERYTQIRKNMLLLVNEAGDTKYTPERVDEILRAAYINGMRRKLFSKTGKKQAKLDKSATGEVKTTFTDMLVENPQALLKFLGETEEEVEVAKSLLGKDHYETVEAIANVLVELTDNPLAQSPVQIRGIPRALSVESYISRLYAINRGVVRPQYVGTEAILQQLRFKNSEFLTAIVTDPNLGRAFLDMVRTGKPLAPERDAQFAAALVQHHALFSQAITPEKEEVVDLSGRKFTISATPMDKVRLGYTSDYTGTLDMPDVRRPGSLLGPKGTPLGGFDVRGKGLLSDIFE